MSPLEAITKGIRDYCASVEVASDGESYPDAMWYAPQYAASVVAALSDAGLAIVTQQREG